MSPSEVARLGLFLFEQRSGVDFRAVSGIMIDKVHLPDAISECVAGLGAQVIDLTLHGGRHSTLVEVFIDAEEPVTTDLCSLVSREVGRMIDARSLVTGSYRLVVSSPGLGRPLKFPWQYKKHLGRTMSVTFDSSEGKRQVVGTLAQVDEVGIVLQTESSEEGTRVRFESIAEAKVKIPW
jgi:ribosome maturation factor RimP